MNVLDYLFVESCRNCRKFIAPNAAAARTLCLECWSPLAAQAAQLDERALPGFAALKVSHAAAYDKTMKRLIYKLKYDGDRLIAEDLSKLLRGAYEKILPHLPDSASPVLFPVPLSSWRLLKRGFNQAELLSRHLARQTALSVACKVLQRNKHTKAQHNLNKQERSLNLQNAFICKIRPPEPGNIILVDDIHTSGATLSEAARTLYAGGAAHVSAITVARALLD